MFIAYTNLFRTSSRFFVRIIRKLASVSGRSDYQMLVTTLLRGGAYSPATDEFLLVLSCNNATCTCTPRGHYNQIYVGTCDTTTPIPTPHTICRVLQISVENFNAKLG